MSTNDPVRPATPQSQQPLPIGGDQPGRPVSSPTLAALVAGDFVLPSVERSEGRTMLDPHPHEYVKLLAKNDLYYRFHLWHACLFFIPSLIIAVANVIMRNTAGNAAREYLKDKLQVGDQDQHRDKNSIIDGINYLGVKDRCLFCRLVESGIIEPKNATSWLARIPRQNTRSWALSSVQLPQSLGHAWPDGTEVFLRQAQPSCKVLKQLFAEVKRTLFPFLDQPEPAVQVEAPPISPEEQQLRCYLDPNGKPAERYSALRSLLPGERTPLSDERLRELDCHAILDLYHSDEGVRNKTIRPGLIVCLAQLVRLNNPSAAAVAKEILESHLDTALYLELSRSPLPEEANAVLRTIDRERMVTSAGRSPDGQTYLTLISRYLDGL